MDKRIFFFIVIVPMMSLGGVGNLKELIVRLLQLKNIKSIKRI